MLNTVYVVHVVYYGYSLGTSGWGWDLRKTAGILFCHFSVTFLSCTGSQKCHFSVTFLSLSVSHCALFRGKSRLINFSDIRGVCRSAYSVLTVSCCFSCFPAKPEKCSLGGPESVTFVLNLRLRSSQKCQNQGLLDYQPQNASEASVFSVLASLVRLNTEHFQTRGRHGA